MMKGLVSIARLIFFMITWNAWGSPQLIAMATEARELNMFLAQATTTNESPLSIPNAAPGASSTTDWLIPIDLQLSALRNKDVEKAYRDATSKDFQKATSLEDFQKFVEHYPILFEHQSIAVKAQSFSGNEAEITVHLDPEKDAIPVRYLLINEDGRWKIWNMNVIPTYSEAVLGLLKDPMGVRKPVELQIAALREDDLLKAYGQYTSKEFRKQTSLEAFRQFVSNFPLFTAHTAVAFKDPVIESGTGKITVDLYSSSNLITVEYTLGIEDDQWKIWGIQILQKSAQGAFTPAKDSSMPTNGSENDKEQIPLQKETLETVEPHASKKLEFAKVEVGNTLDAQGNIEISDSLKSSKDPIHINLYVRNGIAGTKITLNIEHAISKSSIPPVSTNLQQDGNSMVSFVFQPPEQGWPSGEYSLEIIASSGEKKQYSFSVEGP